MSFSLTRKTDYALLALARLASEAADAQQTVSARQIAQQYDLPLPLLMNVMKDLGRAALINAQRGAGGGYALARPAEQISLADVVAAIEGPVAVTMCCESNEDQEQCLGCRLTQDCPITHTMTQFNDVIVAALRSLSIADVMNGKVTFNLRVEREDDSTDANTHTTLHQINA